MPNQRSLLPQTMDSVSVCLIARHEIELIFDVIPSREATTPRGGQSRGPSRFALFLLAYFALFIPLTLSLALAFTYFSSLPSRVIDGLPLSITPGALLWYTLLTTRSSGILFVCPQHLILLFFAYFTTSQFILSAWSNLKRPIQIHIYSLCPVMCLPLELLNFHGFDFYCSFQVHTWLPHVSVDRITWSLKFFSTPHSPSQPFTCPATLHCSHLNLIFSKLILT